MAGRPRKVVDIQSSKMGKKEKINRKIQEEKIKIDRAGLEPPSFLPAKGKKEFKRIVEEAGKIDLLDNLDLSILTIYCNSYCNYIEISQQMKKQEPHMRFASAGRINPLINAQEKYAKQIMQCSAKLGLATTDRLKLIVPTENEKESNPYLKFLEL